MLLTASGSLVMFVILALLLRWTYRKERDLKEPWKSKKDQTRTRLSWKHDDGQWRTLSFDMPIEILQYQLDLAQKGKFATKRA